MPSIQERLRVMASIHPSLNNAAIDLLKEAAEMIDDLRESQVRLKSAIEFAHSEGFQWPSDPMQEFRA